MWGVQPTASLIPSTRGLSGSAAHARAPRCFIKIARAAAHCAIILPARSEMRAGAAPPALLLAPAAAAAAAAP